MILVIPVVQLDAEGRHEGDKVQEILVAFVELLRVGCLFFQRGILLVCGNRTADVGLGCLEFLVFFLRFLLVFLRIQEVDLVLVRCR